MPETIQLHTTEVDLSGLLTVLGSNLYSSPDVAVREIVQNAHDACLRRGLETGSSELPRIRVGANPAEGRIWIDDNGAGLTAEEMRRYLATIGAGYTRVLRGAHDGETGLIGAFGLGFLSAYMIGTRVEVISTSCHTPDAATLFRSDSGRTYVLQAIQARAVGSRVEIELKPDLSYLAQFDKLANLLYHHCRLLKVPVILDWCDEIVNDLTPPWRESEENRPLIRIRKDRMQFAEAFEPVFQPICTLPLTVAECDVGGGLAWIHDSTTYGSADNRRLAVYVNGMRVCGNERDLLPGWAGFISGAYESAHLTPTTSREDLKQDETYFAAQRRIAADLAKGLASLSTTEPEAWRRVLRRHNEALLGAAIADDDLFGAICDDLDVPTSTGDLRLGAVLAESRGRLYVSLSEGESAESILARTLGAPIINGSRYGAFAFARKWAAAKQVELIDVGSARGLDALFPAAEAEAEDSLALLKWFGDGARLRTSRFLPSSLPLLVVHDEAARTKAIIESDAADARLGAGILAMARLFTDTVEAGPERVVVVNLDCPAVGRALALKDTARGAAAGQVLMAMSQVLASRYRASGVSLADSLDGFSKALTTLLEI